MSVNPLAVVSDGYLDGSFITLSIATRGYIVSGLSIQPGLYADADTFYAPSITGNVNISPALYSAPDTFYTPSISGVFIPFDNYRIVYVGEEDRSFTAVIEARFIEPQAPPIPTPPTPVVILDVEPDDDVRVATAEEEGRVVLVDVEDRAFVVAAETRLFTVEIETRSVESPVPDTPEYPEVPVVSDATPDEDVRVIYVEAEGRSVLAPIPPKG